MTTEQQKAWDDYRDGEDIPFPEELITPADLSGVHRWIDDNGIERFTVTAIIPVLHESRWFVLSQERK